MDQIPKGKKETIQLSLLYDKELQNKDEISFQEGKIEIVLADANSLVNPNTSLNHIIIILILLILLIICNVLLRKGKKKFMLLFVILIPMLVIAQEGLVITIPINLTNVVVRGRFLDYQITFNNGDYISDAYTATYGDSITELPVLSKDGAELSKYGIKEELDDLKHQNA